MHQSDLCICLHTHEQHFEQGCSRVNCSCKTFVLVDFAPALFQSSDDLLGALADFFIKSEAHSISPELPWLTKIRESANKLAEVMRKAKG